MPSKVRSGSRLFEMKHKFFVTTLDDNDDDGRRQKLVIQLPINFYLLLFFFNGLGYSLAQSIINHKYLLYIYIYLNSLTLSGLCCFYIYFLLLFLSWNLTGAS